MRRLRSSGLLFLPPILAVFLTVLAFLLSSHSHIKDVLLLEEEQIELWYELHANQLRATSRQAAPDPRFLLEKVRTDTIRLLEHENRLKSEIEEHISKLRCCMALLRLPPEHIDVLVNADIHPNVREQSGRLLDNSAEESNSAFSTWLVSTMPYMQMPGVNAELEERVLITHQFGERLIFVTAGLLVLLCIVLLVLFWTIWQRKMTQTINQLNAAMERVNQHNVELLRAESQSSIAQQTAKFGYWVRNSNGSITCSDGLLYILGLARQDAPQTFGELARCSPEKEHEKLQYFYTTSLESGQSGETVRSLKRSDGQVLYLRERIEIPAGAAGDELQVFGIVLDITARREAETRLVHAQKMEAVGQLTGGIAHDFNNLLAVITGNAELIRMEPKGDSTRYAETIINTVDRGKRLVDQLLLFSSRSSLSPEVLYLSDVLAGMSELVPRSLTEQVNLKFELQDDLWPMYVDRATFENSLLNLIINASSAVDDSGTITISARNISHSSHIESLPDDARGDLIELEIRDDGCGMTEEVAQRAFEPFFTTRSKAGGNGLGLSMVYGFVKSSRGSILIDSEQGEGTSVRIYLPRSMESILLKNKPALTVPRGRGETVLVVEDQQELLDIVTAQLESLGYTTCRAEHAPDAEQILRSDRPIDLMLTDIKLPLGISGVQLAESAIRIRPSMKVVFTTGYADVDFGKATRAIRECKILRKPIGYQAMAEGISETLEQR